MKPKKSVLSYFVIILYLAGILYILVCGVASLGEGREYPYVLQGVFFAGLLGLWLLVNGISAIAARLQIEDWVRKKRKLFRIAEAVIVAVVLLASVYIRWKAVINLPMEPQSDYKTYYEVADLLKRGLLAEAGEAYCNNIALFPYELSYPYILSLVFRLFGTSVFVAQKFNIALAAGTVFLTYRTGKLAGGSMTGLGGLLLAAFWPSQILYVNMVAGECIFSFLFMLCVYLFVLTLRKYTSDAKHPAVGVMLHFLLGSLLAVCAWVHPAAVILLIAIILCLFSQKMRIPPCRPIEQPISLKILSKGWLRLFIIVFCYISVSKFCSMGTEYTIERETASGSASFGYTLLVGLNTESAGQWNQADADYLNDAFDYTQNASQAQLLCRDLAMERLKWGPGVLLNLFLHKYETLWSNDEYGVSWNLFFMDQQGDLTKAGENFLYASRDLCNLFYLLAVAFAGIGGIFLWEKGMDYEYVFALIFVGTAAVYLFAESQNRYHYHVLFIFALMAGNTFKEIYAMNRAKALKIREEKERRKRILLEDEEWRKRELEEEEKLKNLREQAMKSQFDMKDALERGLIKVSVAKIYEEEEKSEDH